MILQLLGILSYVLQYSEYNLIFYRKFSKNCLGRFVEMVPYATTGFTFGTYKTIDYLKKYKYNTIILSLLIFILTDKYNIFIIPNGIAYSGIKYNIRAICLIFLFSLLSSENIKYKLLFNIFKELSNYTAGIFYLHWTVYVYFKSFIKDIKKGTFLGCFYNYLICYLICFISMRFARKTIFKYLFS